jgi:hypothetical protein
MKQFLHTLFDTPTKALLTTWLAIATGIVVVHLTGPSGEVRLTATIATELLLATGGLLFSVGAVAYSYYQKFEALKKEHEEEEQISDGIPFRRGKRTGGRWMAFCPVCKSAADLTITARCPDPKCKWTTYKDRAKIEAMILELRP